jgi:hypothetical protein
MDPTSLIHLPRAYNKTDLEKLPNNHCTILEVEKIKLRRQKSEQKGFYQSYKE